MLTVVPEPPLFKPVEPLSEVAQEGGCQVAVHTGQIFDIHSELFGPIHNVVHSFAYRWRCSGSLCEVCCVYAGGAIWLNESPFYEQSYRVEAHVLDFLYVALPYVVAVAISELPECKVSLACHCCHRCFGLRYAAKEVRKLVWVLEWRWCGCWSGVGVGVGAGLELVLGRCWSWCGCWSGVGVGVGAVPVVAW